jgi:hypothetical protein
MSFLMFRGCGVGLGQNYRGVGESEKVDNVPSGDLGRRMGFGQQENEPKKTKGLHRNDRMLHFPLEAKIAVLLLAAEA